MTTKDNINLTGEYTIEDKWLKKADLSLRVGYRHRPKRGQSQRFIGYIDPTKPEEEQFNYISSLYASQGSKNKYSIEYGGQDFWLNVTAINKVVISPKEPEPALPFEPENIQLAGGLA